MRALVLIAIAIALAACGQADPPATPKVAACAVDADCVLVTPRPPNCCSRCTPDALSVADAARENAWCNREFSGEYHDRCPHLSCICQRTAAKCENKVCTVAFSPCQ